VTNFGQRFLQFVSYGNLTDAPKPGLHGTSLRNRARALGTPRTDWHHCGDNTASVTELVTHILCHVTQNGCACGCRRGCL